MSFPRYPPIWSEIASLQSFLLSAVRESKAANASVVHHLPGDAGAVE
jgi:hypothetical protein